MDPDIKKIVQISSVVAVAVLLFGIFTFCTQSVSQGTVQAAYRFGDYKYTLEPGFHFVNPLNDFHVIDTKQKTATLQRVELPSQDQLTSLADVSVQYRAISSAAQNIVSETGSVQAVIDVHLEPKSRSAIREVAKTVQKAEDLFQEQTQIRLQTEMAERLAKFMSPKGIQIQAVLIRDTQLPSFIIEAINRKKENEQKAEQQKAELLRFETEQQQTVKTAEAQLEAAKLDAEKKKTLADADEYAITKMNAAMKDNPAYLQLQALKSLEAISKDPAAKVYFMNGDAPNPLPLMHIGEQK